jgi:hypothetical protein
VTCTCRPSYSWKCKEIQASPGRKGDPISKITRAQRAGSVAGVADHLLSKYEAQSSNPSTTNKRRKKKKRKKKMFFLD